MVRLTLHFLQQDRHALIVIEQPHAPTIQQGIWVVYTGIDATNGQGECSQVFLWGGLVGAKETLILARKRHAEVVFQQAGRTDDQWALAHLAQNLAQARCDPRRQLSLRVRLFDRRIISYDLLGWLVLLIQVFDVVERQEVIEHVCADEVGARDLNLVGQVRCGRLQHFPGQQHTCRFAADLAGADATGLNIAKIGCGEPGLCQPHEVQLVADHCFGQNDDDFFQMMADLF